MSAEASIPSCDQTACDPVAQALQTQGFLVLAPRGTSMLPLIRQGKDSVKLEPPKGRLRRFDVPLYRRKSGTGVLHRVWKVLPDGYLVCGDHQWELEKITDDQILGVMTALYRKEKMWTLKEKRYRLYLHLFCAMPLWMRHCYWKMRGIAWRICHPFYKKK